jgi:hypothetical protein
MEPGSSASYLLQYLNFFACGVNTPIPSVGTAKKDQEVAGEHGGGA